MFFKTTWLKPIALVLMAAVVAPASGCGYISNRLTYYQFIARGEDTKVRDVVSDSLTAWGKGEFAKAYDAMAPSYRMSHPLSEFLARRQRIDVLLGAPAVSFAVTQVYIYPADPNRAEALVVYKAADGKTTHDIASLRRSVTGRWEITNWWVKG